MPYSGFAPASRRAPAHHRTGVRLHRCAVAPPFAAHRRRAAMAGRRQGVVAAHAPLPPALAARPARPGRAHFGRGRFGHARLRRHVALLHRRCAARAPVSRAPKGSRRARAGGERRGPGRGSCRRVAPPARSVSRSRIGRPADGSGHGRCQVGARAARAPRSRSARAHRACSSAQGAAAVHRRPAMRRATPTRAVAGRRWAVDAWLAARRPSHRFWRGRDGPRASARAARALRSEKRPVAPGLSGGRKGRHAGRPPCADRRPFREAARSPPPQSGNRHRLARPAPRRAGRAARASSPRPRRLRAARPAEKVRMTGGSAGSPPGRYARARA